MAKLGANLPVKQHSERLLWEWLSSRPMTDLGRGCVKTRRKISNDRADGKF
jgi:hypothetical protein